MLVRHAVWVSLEASHLHAKAVLGNSGASSTDVTIADDEHVLIGHELDGLSLPILLCLASLEVLHLLGVVQHAESDELAEHFREGTLGIGQRDRAISNDGLVDKVVDAS